MGVLLTHSSHFHFFAHPFPWAVMVIIYLVIIYTKVLQNPYCLCKMNKDVSTREEKDRKFLLIFLPFILHIMQKDEY